MRKVMLICLICLQAIALLHAQNRQAMLPLESPVYRLCKSLYLEQGLAVPFASYPWSEAELRKYLARLDRAALSPAGQQAYTRIQTLLNWDTDYREGKAFAYNGTLQVNLESYLHATLAQPEGLGPEDYLWTHGYEKRLPMFNLALQFWVEEWLYFTTELALKEEHLAINSPTTPTIADNHFNWFDPRVPYLDIYFPFRAYTSLGGANWGLELGRDQLFWGNGTHTNLILSDYADYHDLLSFTTFWDNFKYSFFNISLEPFTPDHALQDALTFLGHRFEVKLFQRINLALFEVIISTLTPGQFFKELNHMNIYHNWLAGGSCYSIAALEFNCNPWKFINIYAQAALDEFKTAYEAERTGGGGAAKMGYLAGIESYLPLGERYLRVAAEWSTTDPYLYHRGAAPYFYTVRRIWSLVTDSYEYIVKPIGHHGGPDVIDWFFEANYAPLPEVELTFNLEYLIKGETTVADPFLPEGNGLAPTGIPVKTLVLYLGGEYSPWPFLTVGSQLYFIQVANLGHVSGETRSDLEWALSVQYRW